MSDKEGAAVRGGDMVRFLDHHRLSHQPDHYAFAHAYLASVDARLRKAIDRVTDDGVRLTEDHIHQLGGGEKNQPRHHCPEAPDARDRAVTMAAGIAASRQRTAHIIAEAASAQLRLAKDRRQTVAAEQRLITVP